MNKTDYKVCMILGVICVILFIVFIIISISSADIGLALLSVIEGAVGIWSFYYANKQKKTAAKNNDTIKKDRSNNPNKFKGIGVVVIVVCILVMIIAGIVNGCAQSNSYRNKYKNVFNKDPNTWSEDEKDYVDNFIEWHDNEYNK